MISTPTPVPTGSFEIAADVISGSDLALASDGTSWIAAFSAIGSRGKADVFTVPVSSDGSVPDAAPILISDVARLPSSVFNAAQATYSSPAITFDGGDYALVFFGAGGSGDTGDDPPGGQMVFATGISTAGEVNTRISSPVENVSIGTAQPALFEPLGAAAADDSAFVLFSVGSLMYCFVPGCRVSVGAVLVSFATDPPQNDVPFDLAGPGLSNPFGLPLSGPAIAWQGSHALAAWGEVEVRGGMAQEMVVKGALLAPRQEPEGVLIASSDALVDATAVAVGDGQYLVVWRREQELRARLFRPGTGPLGPDDGFVVAAGPGTKRLGGTAFAQGVYLVVWTEEDGRVFVAHISADGNVKSTVEFGDGASGGSAVASNGSTFLVAYLRGGGESGNTANLVGAFVPPP